MGVLIIGAIVFWGLYWGSPILETTISIITTIISIIVITHNSQLPLQRLLLLLLPLPPLLNSCSNDTDTNSAIALSTSLVASGGRHDAVSVKSYCFVDIKHLLTYHCCKTSVLQVSMKQHTGEQMSACKRIALQLCGVVQTG